MNELISIKSHLFIFALLILTSFYCQANPSDKPDYGLFFTAQTTDRDHRTSLEISPNQSLNLPKDGFILDFDLKLREELYSYGYVVRVIFSDSSCFDVISKVSQSSFNIVSTNNDNIITNREIVDPVNFATNKWLNVNVSFLNDDLKIIIEGDTAEINHSYDNFKDAKIFFGVCNHPYFGATEVAPMSIRNISITSHNNKLLYKWALARHDKNIVYDSQKQIPAVGKNDIWEIDKHTNWQKLTSFKLLDVNPQVAYNELDGIYYIAANDNLYTYDVQTCKLDQTTVKGFPYKGASSQIVYDSKRNQLISYTIENNILRFYDFENNAWSHDNNLAIGSRQHHNKIIDTQRDQLLVFGGYGNYHFNAQLSTINIQNPAEGWQTKTLDSLISPRYLCAMGGVNSDEILIMGGYGSRSGLQEENPKNFYDLYLINTQTKKNTKLWELNNIKEHFTLGNTLIVDTLSNSIYALTYNNNRYNTAIYLSRFDIKTKKPHQEIVSDSIPYNFLDIRSYCDVFLHEATSSLYAIVVHEISANESEVNIYKLVFPPLPIEQISYNSSDSQQNYIIFLALSLLVVGGCAYLVYRNRKRQATSTLCVDSKPEEEKIAIEESNQTKRHSTILLLGGFQIFDKDGNDMTGNFTPTLRSMFLFFFLNSVNNGRGVSSQQLDDTFWYDMDKAKATNNRNVNIRKLRLLLDKIGGVAMVNKGSYWHLEVGDNVECDYIAVTKGLLELKSSKNSINRDVVKQVVNFATAGVLLPNVEMEWVDKFKSYYSTLVMETMTMLANSSNIHNDNHLLLGIAEVMLISDSIDEDSIIIKCRTLYQMGKKGTSKQTYDKYYDDYCNLLNTPPDLTYDEIINGHK